VAGPVLAQDAMSPSSTPAASTTTGSGKSMHAKCPSGQHWSKKQSKCVAKHSKSGSSSMGSTTTGQ
jgi:hypothetical protein